MLTGVIEGFYGRAWTAVQRVEMMDWIAAAGMNLFVYAPKDDIKIRTRWRDPYDAVELAALAELAAAAQARGLRLMTALSPCLDITHSDAGDVALLCARVDKFIHLGIRDVALLFDDIPGTLNPADRAAFASLADAQVHVANAAQAHLDGTQGRLYVCPTEYCAAFTGHNVAGSAYLQSLGAGLAPGIEVFWTGPDIVSKTIDVAGLRAVAQVLRRKPFIWDNFHANDYDLRRVHAGPLAGRDRAVLDHVSGWITNPNNEFEANFVPVMTTGAFLSDPAYQPDLACCAAIGAWAARFGRDGNGAGRLLPPMPDALIGLLVDLCHQPFACGPAIESWLDMLESALGTARPDTNSALWRAALAGAHDLYARVNDLFDRMTELKNRDLFHTFHPYLWEARAELRQLVRYLDWLDTAPAAEAEFPHDRLVDNFYRRGFAASLNYLLRRNRRGGFRHGN